MNDERDGSVIKQDLDNSSNTFLVTAEKAFVEVMAGRGMGPGNPVSDGPYYEALREVFYEGMYFGQGRMVAAAMGRAKVRGGARAAITMAGLLHDADADIREIDQKGESNG